MPASMPPPEPPVEAEPEAPAHHVRPARHQSRLNPVQRWLVACSPVATVLAGLGYFTYSQLSVTDVAGLLPATPPTEIQALHDPGGIVTVGVVLPRTAPVPVPEPAAMPRAVVVDDPLAPSEYVATPRGKPAPPSTNSDRPVEPTPVDVGPCTAGVAALGLCTSPTLAAKE